MQCRSMRYVVIWTLGLLGSLQMSQLPPPSSTNSVHVLQCTVCDVWQAQGLRHRAPERGTRGMCNQAMWRGQPHITFRSTPPYLRSSRRAQCDILVGAHMSKSRSEKQRGQATIFGA